SSNNRDNQIYDADGVRQVAGCVPVVRVPTSPHRQVVLITSRKKPDEWSLPKGGWELGETPEEAVLREAWEEAGIRGRIIKSLGVYAHTKQVAGRRKSDFRFFEVEVETLEDAWPESEERLRRTVRY
ncbi:NUDIX hydrolase domain-like protein, partial [Blyttiomyces helicus]